MECGISSQLNTGNRLKKPIKSLYYQARLKSTNPGSIQDRYLDHQGSILARSWLDPRLDPQSVSAFFHHFFLPTLHSPIYPPRTIVFSARTLSKCLLFFKTQIPPARFQIVNFGRQLSGRLTESVSGQTTPLKPTPFTLSFRTRIA